MSLIPGDLTPVYKAAIARGTGASRWQRPAFVDLLLEFYGRKKVIVLAV